MLAAFKIFGGHSAHTPELVAESAATSGSPLESVADSAATAARHMAPEVKRIYFRNEGPAPTRIPTPKDDARELVRWVAEAGYAGEPVLSEDMERAYLLMCRVHGRAAYPWQLVGGPLRELTGGRKQYTRIRLEPAGPKKYRRRVYLIPSTA